MRFDRLISNSRIVDGTGAPWYRGHVGISDGAISYVGRGRRPEKAAEEVIDIEGNILAPGFIDSHSHSDLQLFEDPMLVPKTRQGVTTEILGQDGYSVAPIHEDQQTWANRLSTINGRTSEPWGWDSVEAYLDTIDQAKTIQNFGTLVGHGTVRFNSMGMADRAPTDNELKEMRELIVESLEAGALGFSTGLIYAPQSHASTEELTGLVEPLGKYGRPFVAHIRSEGRWIWDALDEFADIGREVQTPIHLSHYKLSGRGQQGKAPRSNQFLEATREREIDMTAEVYPYTAGQTALSAVLPPWLQTKGQEELKSLLDAPETRERIRLDIEEWRIPGWENIGGLAGWENIVVTGVGTSENTHYDGMSVEAIAVELDISPIDAVCKLLLDEDFEVKIIVHSMAESDVRAILENRRVAVASDGIFGDSPHPRLYGTFPRVLGRYVRDENLISLEEGIRKMTSLPARIMGLQKKGIIREGMDADLVVLDDQTISSKATFEHPRRHPVGIKHVFVDGQPVIYDETFTGKKPGSVVLPDG